MLEISFCGNSVYICGLAASLQQVRQLRIRLLDNVLDKVMPDLKMIHPDVVILEAVNHKTEMVDALFGDNPHLRIIVIHPETDSLEIFSGGRCLKASVDDLTRVVRECD